MQEDSSKIFMKRALDLAKLGIRKVYPNPMVGAVIVKNDKIIGEGYHNKYGEAHAEVNAINSVKNKEDLKDSTLFVTLEPCSHYGKTPPCSDLIIKNNIPKVIIACKDIFAKVDGSGIQKLKNAGVNVSLGLMEKEAVELNKRFFTFHSKNRPFITLKWAETKDGFIDKKRDHSDKGVNWITQPETQTIVHRLRAEEHGILVGINTIINDNPSLDVRKINGTSPIRIVLDPNCRISSSSKVVSDGNPTILFCIQNSYPFNLPNIKVVELKDFKLEIILGELHKHNILSVFVEGGQKTINHFIEKGFWDEIHQFIGQNSFHEGLKAPKIISGTLESSNWRGKDLYNIYKNK